MQMEPSTSDFHKHPVGPAGALETRSADAPRSRFAMSKAKANPQYCLEAGRNAHERRQGMQW